MYIYIYAKLEVNTCHAWNYCTLRIVPAPLPYSSPQTMQAHAIKTNHGRYLCNGGVTTWLLTSVSPKEGSRIQQLSATLHPKPDLCNKENIYMVLLFSSELLATFTIQATWQCANMQTKYQTPNTSESKFPVGTKAIPPRTKMKNVTLTFGQVARYRFKMSRLNL